MDPAFLWGGGALAALAGFTAWLLKDYIATLKKAVADEQAGRKAVADDLRAETAAVNRLAEALEDRNRLDHQLLDSARRRT